MSNNIWLDKAKNLWYNTERRFLMEGKRKRIEVQFLKLLEGCGAFLRGHFELRSGLHTDCYIQTQMLLKDPQAAEFAGKLIADRFRGMRINKVVGPAKGAIVLAHEVARALKCTSVFAERHDEKFEFRRGQHVGKEDRILVVEDVVTTGKSTGEVVTLIEKASAQVVGLGCLIDRSKREEGKFDDICFESLLKVPPSRFFYFQPWECPHCRAGLPLT